jgi:urocanate reductase
MPGTDGTSADVIVVGAGPAGLAAAISAADLGADVLVLEENFDIGGHAMLSGGLIHLGGGHAMQQRLGVEDSPEQIFRDWVRADHQSSRYADRDMVRVFADENVATFDFLVDNGVTFVDQTLPPPWASTVPRYHQSEEWPVEAERIAPGHRRNGSGLVRTLARSARAKGVRFLLRHSMTGLRRTRPSGPVDCVEARHDGSELVFTARRGMVLATGGHSSNVNLRRLFDPRLTEEYQVAGEPYSRQSGASEIAAMRLGATLWATANQTSGHGLTLVRPGHIGCRWGYPSLKFEPASPIFHLARASGLTVAGTTDVARAAGRAVADWSDIVLVNQVGRRFWNEADDTTAFLDAALGHHPDSGQLNGGGPIWAIFDSATVRRRGWNVEPPHVDPDGYFFSADTLEGLAAAIANPYQKRPMDGAVLAATIARYNSFVRDGADADFGRTPLEHPVAEGPFFAAWATPMIHDSLTGLRTDTSCAVLDIDGQPIPGLYCAGESQGGFAQHGIGRCLVFGRIAGRSATARIEEK